MNEMNWDTTNELSQKFGASFFVFDETKFEHNFKRLKSAFASYYPKIEIGYSYKTNYTPYICNLVNALGGLAEVVSEMEFDLARRLGVAGNRIIYNGPYKSERSFKEAILSGAIVNLDSTRDLKFLKQVVAENPNQELECSIRCNFELKKDSISRFGMDVEGDEFKSALAYIAETKTTTLAGLHCHFPERDLASFKLRAEKMLSLANSIFKDTPPMFLNIGGGYFSSMPESLQESLKIKPATFDDYGKVIGELFAENYKCQSEKPTLLIEPGTALVADTFRFFTKVISTKTIRGQNVGTVAGSIFDFSASARVKNLPVSVIGQPKSNMDQKKWILAGFTCIEDDTLSLAQDTVLEVNDFLMFENVGSYSIVMKPPFILPASAVLCASKNGSFDLIKRRESNEQIFENYIMPVL